MDETTKKILSTTDGKVWAEEFCKMYPSMDEDAMLTRFANAIELGKSTQQSFIIKNRTTEEFERQKKLYKDVGLYHREMKKEKSEGMVIGGGDHKNYIDFGEYLKLQKEKEELEKEVERLQKVLYTLIGSGDDGEPDLYEDVEGDLC